jgi:lipopolysaccharide transport system permease protein
MAVSKSVESTATLPNFQFVIEPKSGWQWLNLREIFQYRELLFFLVWRDIKVKYKQTVLGGAWAILQPLITMLTLTVIFGNFAKIPSDGVPYPVFAFAALLPWTYFAQALTRSGNSLVGNAHLITKVYFPRLLIPIASAVTPAVDFVLSFLALAALLIWFGIRPTWSVVALPLFMLLAFMTAFSAGLWLSPINVRYRDVAHIIPFITQLWMYASPVVYPVSLVPSKWRLLYSLNPMAGVIEGFRWALLATDRPDFRVMAVSAAAVLMLLLGGILFFKRMERSFADIV